MSKKKIVKYHKQDLCAIVEKIILKKHPELDPDTYLPDIIKQKEEEVNKYFKDLINFPKFVYNYLKDYNLLQRDERYLHFNLNTRNSCNINYYIVIYQYLQEHRYRKYEYNNTNEYLYNIISYKVADLEQEIQLIINEKEKQYNEIYKNFTNIIYALKYLDDAVKYFDNDEIKEYVEKQLKVECTSLSTINPQSIDFVKNFFEEKDKKELDK